MFNINNYYLGYIYPESYLKLVDLNLVDFEYWYFIPDNQLDDRIIGLMERYPDRKLIPFARRDDNDDIACFEIGKEEKVEIIHDFASRGYEQRKEYTSIWRWVEDALNELIINSTIDIEC